jgi:hypothetical protein
MKQDNKKDQLKKERQEAVKEIHQHLKTLNLGDDIHIVLEASDFSHQDIADIIGCERSNITHLCTRENSMDIVQLVLLSVALEHNFLDKVFDLLKPGQESILPERFTIDISPSSVRIINQTEPMSVKKFRLQEE